MVGQGVTTYDIWSTLRAGMLVLMGEPSWDSLIAEAMPPGRRESGTGSSEHVGGSRLRDQKEQARKTREGKDDARG